MDNSKKKTPGNKQSSGRPSGRKKLIFYILTLLIPVIFLVLLETGLQLFNYGGNTRLFIPLPEESSPYYGINLKVGLRYFNGERFCPTPRKDLFLREKPANGYRIFVLGGSTTAGYPYGNNITFPRILHRRLNDIYPGIHIEIVNMAMTAISSYTLLDYLDEILEQAPDALLVYAGHNEFYGALGVGSVESLGQSNRFVRIYLKLQNFKTVRLLRDIILQTAALCSNENGNTNAADDTQTQMSRIVKNKEIFYDSRIYNLGKKQFYNNLEIICSQAKAAGIKVILSELVSNIRDQIPFGSKAQGEIPAAFDLFKQARELELSGNYQEAKQAYYRAKDLDPVRFRASEDFNDIIHQIGSKFNLPVVPMKQWFEQASPNGLIGASLMHEHLHPNLDGYFLMAEAFLQKIVEQRLIEAPIDKAGINSTAFYKKTWGWTMLDSLYADLNIKRLKGGWPFKKEGPNLALSAFIPKSIVDSVSLEIQQDQRTLEQGHMFLASYFEQKDEFAQAFAEHKALIYTVPYLDLFYEPAVKMLLQQQNYQPALEILEYGIHFNQSPFMMKWLGQLNLVYGHTQRGVFYLENALQLLPADLLVIYNLSRAYYKLARFDQGDALYSRLREMAPNSPYITDLLNYKNSLIKP